VDVGVAVLVAVAVGVFVGVSVGVLVAVSVGVLVGVSVGVLVGVSVVVGVSAPASRGETKNSAATRASAAAMVIVRGHTPCGRTGNPLLLLSKVRVIIGGKKYFQQPPIPLIVARLGDMAMPSA